MLAPNFSWTRERAAVLLPYVMSAIGIAVIAYFAGEAVHRHLRDFDQWIESLGPRALFVFILLYAVLSTVFVPDLLLGIAAGASFGFTHGVVVVLIGSLLGSMAQFGLAHRLLKQPIERLVANRPAMANILRAIKHEELKLQLLIRLTPLNRAFTSYMLGAVGVDFNRFMVACIALLPSLAMEVYTGVAGKHFAAMTGRTSHQIAMHDIVMVISLLTALAVIASISRIAKRALDAAAARDFNDTMTTIHV